MSDFPDLVIFDCDGVLVDSEPISIRALLDLIGKVGGKMSEKTAYEAFLGKSMATVASILQADHQLIVSDIHLDHMRDDLYTRFRAELKPISGVKDALDALPCRTCVASSGSPERIRLSLELTGLLASLEPHLFSAAMVQHGKPAPDLFLHAARAMGVAPDRCVVIEDSPAGIAAAKAAGMRVFGFVGGAHAHAARLAESLAALDPELIFDDMAQLPALLGATRQYVCAVDVGTSSARAGIIDAGGRLIGRADHPILMHQPLQDHAEQDSEDIWRAVCHAVRAALKNSGAAKNDVIGISFDATCSLVVRGRGGAQLSVSTSGESRWDTIVWLDHRALAEADECTSTRHAVLDFIGGVMSPEMATPKLMWLKRHLPDTWRKTAQVFDLTDFLTWKASGSSDRSQNTLTAKWTYLAHEQGWRRDFFVQVGLDDLFERTGAPQRAAPIGEDLGPLTAGAAEELGLSGRCRVGVGVIDAYAGALGVLGQFALDLSGIDRHLALIAGTSSCVMAMSHEPRPFDGVWGPYFGAAFPDCWLSEGGQSATGALLDHIIEWHGAGSEATPAMHARIAERVMELRREEGLDLAGRLHILPDFHGNRSPYADPHALGVISGLALDSSFDSLCRLYWRSCVAIALGVRQILDALNERGYVIDTLHVTGGHTKNPLLMELYADATGCTVVEPAPDTDAVLLGAAMIAAAAARIYPDLSTACAAMSQPGRTRLPHDAARMRFDKDYRVFLEMHRQRQALEAIR